MKTIFGCFAFLVLAFFLSGGARAQSDELLNTRSNEIVECYAAFTRGKDMQKASHWNSLYNIVVNYDVSRIKYLEDYSMHLKEQPLEVVQERMKQCGNINPTSYIHVSPPNGGWATDPYTRLTECYGILLQFKDSDDSERSFGETAANNLILAMATYQVTGDSDGRENHTGKYSIPAEMGQISQEDMLYCLQMSRQLIR